jgi:integrase
MKKDKLWVGISKHGAGWRASVSQGRGRPLIQMHFPKGTDPREMQAWRADTKAKLRLARKQRATMGSFAYDAKRYLAAVTALPTYKERKIHIEQWTAIFGTIDRSRITSAEIRAVRDQWLTESRGTHPKTKTPLPPLAPGSVNRRLRALSNLFTVLDGRRAPNPVRDVPEAIEPYPEPKALDYDLIAKILAAMPDRGQRLKGQKASMVNKTKIRLSCLAYCPITPKQLKAITPADLDLERGMIRLPARSKGRGAQPITQKLLPQALDAFQQFHAHNLYGPFSQRPLAESFRRAAKKVTTEKVWPYRLRHSFGTVAYRATGSLELVGLLMQHREKRTTRQYALAAEQSVLDQTIALVAAGITDRHDGLTKNDELGAKMTTGKQDRTQAVESKGERKPRKTQRKRARARQESNL